MSLAIAVEASDNSKVGRSHATYASQKSCPPTCPLLGAGCYAEVGPTGFHTKRLNDAAATAAPLDVAYAEAEAIGRLSGKLDLRVHVVGDCTTNEAADVVSRAALNVLRPGSQTWSYTHAWRTVDRAAWNGMSVLASVESPRQAIEALDRGWGSAMVVAENPSDKLYVRDGVKLLPCVYETRGVQCVECRLCFDSERLRSKGITIAFSAHGSRFKNVRRVLATIQ